MQDAAFFPKALSAIERTPDECLFAVSPDLSVQLIHDVVIAAYDPHVVNLSKFAPVGSKGHELYIHATENLRDRLSASGWETSDVEQVACVLNRKSGVRIACSTDGGPCVGIDCPSGPALRKKGKGTIRLAGYGIGDTLPFPGLEMFLKKDELQRVDDFDFYYLFIHLDEAKKEIRIELSKPIFEDTGTVRNWSERIILPPIATSPNPSFDARPVPAPEIAIARKVS